MRNDIGSEGGECEMVTHMHTHDTHVCHQLLMAHTYTNGIIGSGGGECKMVLGVREVSVKWYRE